MKRQNYNRLKGGRKTGLCAYSGCLEKRVSKYHPYCLKHRRMKAKESARRVYWKKKGVGVSLETLSKAMVVIEFIALEGNGDDKNMGLIYQAAHVANNRCLNTHDDWNEWLDKFYNHLVAVGEHNPDPIEARKRLQEAHGRFNKFFNLPAPPRVPSPSEV